jgi:hypothetical protein
VSLGHREIVGDKAFRKKMEQIKYYVKLYINRADEYQSITSLNPLVFCVLPNAYL